MHKRYKNRKNQLKMGVGGNWPTAENNEESPNDVLSGSWPIQYCFYYNFRLTLSEKMLQVSGFPPVDLRSGKKITKSRFHLSWKAPIHAFPASLTAIEAARGNNRFKAKACPFRWIIWIKLHWRLPGSKAMAHWGERGCLQRFSGALSMSGCWCRREACGWCRTGGFQCSPWQGFCKVKMDLY